MTAVESLWIGADRAKARLEIKRFPQVVEVTKSRSKQV